MHRASNELAQVEELLAHAIEQLMMAFNGVNEGVCAQRREFERHMPAVLDSPEGDRLRAAGDVVAREIDRAVTALQFGDVVGQKLKHVHGELDDLGQVIQRLRLLSGLCAESSSLRVHPRGRGAGALAAAVRELLLELEQPKNASPAGQEMMHAGEVELF